MAIAIPGDVGDVLQAPTTRPCPPCAPTARHGTGWGWVGVEGDHLLVCSSDAIWKAQDMRRDPRVAIWLADMANRYRMAAIQDRFESGLRPARPLCGQRQKTAAGK